MILESNIVSDATREISTSSNDDLPDDVAIRVQNLSKCYHIYDKPHDRLKQFVVPKLCRVIQVIKKLFPTVNSHLSASGAGPVFYKEFWALRNVSFDVRKGETVGIIGRNGSGKSTLLQLICGTLNPTSGSIHANGRIAALLELGSGFNPEFTGRENVYLNAAVLGLREEEVDARYGEILAFADIGNFIEQPVKTYSSGMMVRLAFAVIAHVDADILVIDEALAVGDVVFTQKCMRFLRRFMEQGTVLFVSHDTASVSNLCQRAIWLNHGIMRMHDAALEVTKSYAEYCTQEIYGDKVKLNSVQGRKITNSELSNIENEKIIPVQDAMIHFYENIANSDGWKTGAAEIIEVLILSSIGEPINVFLGGEKVLLRIRAISHQILESPIIGFLVKDRLGQPLFGENTYLYVQPPCAVFAGDCLSAEFEFVLPLLPNGEYSMTVSIADGTPHVHTQHHWLHDAVLIRVQSPALRYGLVGIPFSAVTMSKTTL